MALMAVMASMDLMASMILMAVLAPLAWGTKYMARPNGLNRSYGSYGSDGFYSSSG